MHAVLREYDIFYSCFGVFRLVGTVVPDVFLMMYPLCNILSLK